VIAKPFVEQDIPRTYSLTFGNLRFLPNGFEISLPAFSFRSYKIKVTLRWGISGYFIKNNFSLP
jgi:hypothetical protein